MEKQPLEIITDNRYNKCKAGDNMTMQKLLSDRNMSVYKLSKACEIPYMTCNDIVNGKTHLEKCSADTVYKIANILGISMEELLAPYMVKRSSFENFKSTICHRVKEKGDIEFIIDVLEGQDIRFYYEKKWYPECLYLLAMVDYLSRLNDISLCDEYDDLRKVKLDKPLYPASLVALSMAANNEEELIHATNTAIPEFRRFNIIENEVRNVV